MVRSVVLAHFLVLSVTSASPHQETARHIHELIEKLRSERIEEREEAACRLKELGQDVIPELRRAAQCGDAEVSLRALLIIKRIEIERALSSKLKEELPDLAFQLAHGSDHEWTEAYLEAAKSGVGSQRYRNVPSTDLEPMAAPALRGARTPEDRALVASAIARWRHKTAIPNVLALLEDNDSSVRRTAIWALGSLSARAYSSRVVPLLRDPDPSVRAMAARILEDLSCKNASTQIRMLLGDPDREVRLAAISALGALNAKEAAGEIALHLREDNLNETAAAEALGRLGAREYAVDVARLLVAPDCHVRIAALRSLGEMGAAEQGKNVAKLLHDEVDIVQIEAAVAIGRLGAREYVRDLIPCLKKNNTQSHAAAKVLSGLATPEHSDQLSSLLKDSEADPIVRRLAMRILVGLHETAQAGVLDSLLTDPDSIVVMEALDLTGIIGTKQHLGVVLGYLGHKDDWLQYSAALALGRLAARCLEADERQAMVFRFRELERDRDVKLAHGGSIGLLRLGVLQGKAQKELVAKMIADKTRTYGEEWTRSVTEVNDVLVNLHEAESAGILAKRFTLQKTVSSLVELADLTVAQGLRLEHVGDLQPYWRAGEGTNTTLHRLLSWVWDPAEKRLIVVERGLIRPMRADDAMDYWLKRLSTE